MPGGKGNKGRTLNKRQPKKVVENNCKINEAKDGSKVANVNKRSANSKEIVSANKNPKKRKAATEELKDINSVQQTDEKGVKGANKAAKFKEKELSAKKPSEGRSDEEDRSRPEQINLTKAAVVDLDNCLEISVSMGNESFCQSDYGDEDGEIIEFEPDSLTSSQDTNDVNGLKEPRESSQRETQEEINSIDRELAL